MEIEDLLPDDDSVNRATEQAILYIPQAAEQVSNLVYRNRGMSGRKFGPVLGPIIESNISTVGDPGRARQLEQMLESDQRNGGGGVVAPSFTLGRW